MQQSRLFLLLYTLAWAGGTIAYVPLLTVLLPARIAGIAGDEAVAWLASISFVGAIAASLGNIGFGWLSDRMGSRRMVAAAGLALSSVLLIAIGRAETLPVLLIVITGWQLSLNMMLSPLAAWAGDTVPDAQKGQLGGLLSIAPAIGAAAGIVVTLPGLFAGEHRLSILVLMIAAFVLPLLVWGRPKPFPALTEAPAPNALSAERSLGPRRAVTGMWLARLLIQITEAALFSYLLLWLRSLSDAFSENAVAWVYSVVLMIGIPLAMVAGRWADKRNKPIQPLAVCAACVAVGLAVMGVAPNVTMALVGYLVFGVAGAVFLALHSAQTLRVLPQPTTRGRDLGIFNLTNTLPALIMPGLTLALVPVFGFAGLFFLLCALAAMAGTVLFALARAG
ncbi:MAG: MFS transporter [Pseudomonadota bacterium]